MPTASPLRKSLPPRHAPSKDRSRWPNWLREGTSSTDDRRLSTWNAFESRVALAESLPTTKLANLSMPSDSRSVRDRTEYDARVSCTVPPAPGSAWADGIPVDVGPLIPLWLPHPEGSRKPRAGLRTTRRYRRRANCSRVSLSTGPRLRESLLDEARDLLVDAELVRVLPDASEVDPAGRYLANVPAALIASAPVIAVSTGSDTGDARRSAWPGSWPSSPSLAVGITLHKSVELSERRRRFVSTVTHELRTPLTTFKMYSEMLAEGVVPEGERRQQYLETLKDESERLSTLVDNVLTQARLEQRAGVRRTEKLTLEGLLARVTPPLHRQAEMSGMTLDVDCASPESSPVEVDSGSIGQVLRNLVDNAGKYGRNGANSMVSLHVELQNGALIMKVRDHGPGVAQRRGKSIFSPFDRGDRDAADPSPGLGLGLSIARGLARDMNGDVTLESPPDGGACFRLEVPAS